MSSNVLAKLAKLGSAHPSRRRIADPSEMEDEESYVPEISDVAPLPPPISPPETEERLSPTSSDVRANQVIEEQEAEPNLHRNVGRALGELARGEEEIEAPVEKAAEESAMDLDRARAREEMERGKEPGFWSKLGSSLSNALMQGGGLVGQGVKALSNEISRAKSPEGREEIARNLAEQERKHEGLNLGAQEYAEKNAPQLIEKEKEAQGAQQANFNEQIASAMENPWTRVAYGSADEISRSPALQANVSEIAGIDWEPEVADQVKRYEAALDEISNGYRKSGEEIDAQVEAIKGRIERNEATDMDKWYVGLSLLLPLVVGGFFGTEAGLGALGGAAEGLASAVEKNQKRVSADQEALANLSKLKMANQELQQGLEMKRASLPEEVRKSLPKDAREHLVGLQEVSWVDPRTGHEKSGVQIRPGFVVPPSRLRNEKAIVAAEKAADELAEKKTYTDRINEITDEIIGISSKLKNQNILQKGFAHLATKSLPGSLSTFTEDIEWDGRKVNAGQLLEQKLGFLANAYTKANQLGQIDAATQRHLDKIFLNPTKTLATAQDSITQMLEARKLIQRDLLHSAENAGFDVDLLASELGMKNRALHERLNAKEDKKLLEQRKRMLTE